jgi:hypothetical protein
MQTFKYLNPYLFKRVKKMVKKNIEDNDRIIEAKIFGETKKKQMSIRIPARFIDLFKVNPKKDRFYWVIDGEDELSLRGQLVKGETKQEDEKKS